MTLRNAARHVLLTSMFMVSLGLAAPAMALDADDFATRFSAMTSQAGSRLTFSAIDPDGGTIVLRSVRMTVPGKPAYTLGDVTFEGVEQKGDGSYMIDETTVGDIEVLEDGNTISIGGLEITGLIVPAESAETPPENLFLYEGLSTGEIRVERGETQVFSLSALDLKVEQAPDGSTVEASMTGSDLTIDLSGIEHRKANDALAQLGYDTVTGDLRMEASWDKTAGIVDLEEYSISLDKVGRLALSLEIAGYTSDFLRSLQKAQIAAAANPDQDAARQEMEFAMLGLLPELGLKSASLRFEDASVTQRALDYAGSKQGISGEQMRQAAKFLMPFALGQLGVPSLQRQIAAAVSIYLDNPQNITITASPAEPVALPMILGAGMGDPRSLADLLNIEVSANKPIEMCCGE